MSQGTFTGTGASVAVLAADIYRDELCIQMIDATAEITIAFGTTVVADQGIKLVNIGDSVTIRGWLARESVNVIGDGGICVYQDGNIVHSPGPTPTA